jgi:hypothetical protein
MFNPYSLTRNRSNAYLLNTYGSDNGPLGLNYVSHIHQMKFLTTTCHTCRILLLH